ncbi:hypothetical protein C0J52_03544 [Blattella germanica]|nr:hypothetical protein C0J52_03544 [Blattella germanica]
MAETELPGFGVELPDLVYDGTLRIDFHDFKNPLSAFLNGGRLPYLWLATLLHGVVVEIITYNLDDIDNFWHSQTPIIFLGRRLPLHIIALCIQSSEKGLSILIFHLTIHYALFLGLTIFGHPEQEVSIGLHERIGPFMTEMTSVILAAMLGMPGGVLLFLPLYHPLHDLAGIHSEVTFFMLFTIFLLICWTGDRQPLPEARPRIAQVGWDPHMFQAVKVKVIQTMKLVMKRQIGGGIRKTLNPNRNNI